MRGEYRGDAIVPIDSNNENADPYELSMNPTPDPRSRRNVYLVIAFAFFMRTGMAIWSRSVLSAYVYLISEHSPEAVGYVTSVLSYSQLLVSFPGGHYGIDNFRRDFMLKVASIVGVFALLATFLSARHHHFSMLLVALGLWGLTNGISQPAIGAIFTDSLPKEDRQKFFAQKSTMMFLGNVLGPLIALGAFEYLGNTWNKDDCRFVILLGQAFILPAVVSFCFMNDKYSTGSDSNATDIRGLPRPEENDSRENKETARDNVCCCVPEDCFIPACIVCSEVLNAIATGLSMRYYTIFFLKNLGLDPVEIQLIQLLMPLSVTILSKTTSVFAAALGSYRTTAIMKWIGIVMKLGMLYSYIRGQSKFVVCTFMVFRTGFMASTQTLTKFMLIKAVPRREHWKWSSLESINLFFFSGSGIIGGIIVANYGIICNFLVTAVLQLIATLPIMVLFKYDEHEVRRPAERGSDGETPLLERERKGY